MSASDEAATSPTEARDSETSTTFSSLRTRRQAGLFFGGAAFVLFSTLITRRSLARRYRAQNALLAQEAGPTSKMHGQSTPLAKGRPTSGGDPGYTTAAAKAEGEASGEAAADALQNSPTVLAVEALTVATMNVISWSLMATGGLLWYFDIASMDDLRRKVRGGLGVDGTGRSEQEAEEEMEEWLATVLTRKEEKKRIADEVRRNERGKER